MTGSQHEFVAGAYTPRARDYLDSAVHRDGEDLDQLEQVLRGLGGASRDAAGLRALDLGCGGGHVEYRAAPHVAGIVACDITAAMLDIVRATAAARGLANVEVRQAAAEALPFPDAAFDVVLSRFSAHHWGDLDAGLREARRVLKPLGTAILIDIVSPANRMLDTHLQAVELLRDPSHVRDHGVAELVSALARAGFTPASVTMRRLRMDFAAWIARTRTPPLHADAIRALQEGAPDAVRAHFAIGPDGSFDLEAATLVLHAA